ncbi:MAG: amidohydrolase family protein [Chthoniobacteraceae bacterium]|nr:amidohydrolase family protein [Chthoniobacteraceae bacterium]
MLSSLAITDADPLRWIVAGQLLDAKNRRVLQNAHLVYTRERIVYVGAEAPSAAVVNGKKTPDLALPDYTAMPGLIEGHSHVFLEGAELDIERRTAYLKQDSQTLYQRAENRVRTLARLGIIAMRDGGDNERVGLRLSRLSASKNRPPYMANVFSPGAAIHRRGRYGSFFGKPLEDHPDIESCVQARVSEGADHIKIVPTGIINFAKGAVVAKPQFSVEEIQQFKRAACAHGKHLMAHASGELGVDYAIDGGVDTLEHGFFITDGQLAKMRDRAISWLPTLTPVQAQVDNAEVMGWEGQTLDNLKRILENHARSIQEALALGVNVLVGSDAGSCGVAHGTGLLREMELLEAAGMSTADILYQATYGNHRALTNQHPVGSLEETFKPRFLLTKNNPLETVKNLALERVVLFDGAAESNAGIGLGDL